MKKSFSIYQIAGIGVMAALVFVSTQFRIPIPLSIGNVMVHLGNIFCILSALLLGPVGGGLAAGIGSFFFDLMDPAYIATSWATLLFKFLMAFVCGLIVYGKTHDGKNTVRNVVGAISGLVTYIILHLSFDFIKSTVFLRMAVPTALVATGTSFLISLVNAVIAVVVAVPLGLAVRKGLEGNHVTHQFLYR